MPTNVSPEYKKAEALYKGAGEPREKLTHLREMLRTIPKHKGTEHLQAAIKTKIKELTQELAAPKKTGARGGQAYTFRPEGAGQIALLGPPNSGKSSLHHELTGSEAAIGAYPFTTHLPKPGMAPLEDVGIQLIDLPPITSEHPLPWIGNALQPADGALLIVDVADPGCVSAVRYLVEILKGRNVFLTGCWPKGPVGLPDLDHPFAKVLPTVAVASKADLTEQVEEEIEVLLELADLPLPFLRSSIPDGEVDHLASWLFSALEVVRVYTVAAGERKDDRPYTIRLGQTVQDVAELIHKDLARDLKFARLIRPDQPDRRIGRAFPLEDGDRIEILT